MKSPPFLLAAVLALAGCSSVAVTTEKDPGADLATPRTYAWMMEQDLGKEGGRTDRENTYAAVVVAVEESLAAKGWVLNQDPATSDVVLAFQVDHEKTVAVASFADSSRNPWSWNRFYGAVERDVRVSTFDVGTLVLDIVVPTTHHLLWRGTAKAEVHPSDTRETKAALAVEAVRKMFDGFPGR